MQNCDLVTSREFAELAGYSRGYLRNLKWRGELPPPIPLASPVLVWRRADIENWIAERDIKRPPRKGGLETQGASTENSSPC